MPPREFKWSRIIGETTQKNIKLILQMNVLRNFKTGIKVAPQNIVKATVPPSNT